MRKKLTENLKNPPQIYIISKSMLSGNRRRGVIDATVAPKAQRKNKNTLQTAVFSVSDPTPTIFKNWLRLRSRCRSRSPQHTGTRLPGYYKITSKWMKKLDRLGWAEKFQFFLQLHGDEYPLPPGLRSVLHCVRMALWRCTPILWAQKTQNVKQSLISFSFFFATLPSFASGGGGGSSVFQPNNRCITYQD